MRPVATGERSAPHGEEGVALLLVLVVIVLTISSVFAVGRTSVLEVTSARHRADRVRAQLLAKSGVDLALRALVEDATGPPEELTSFIETGLDTWSLLGRAPLEPFPGGEMRLTVRDAGSRINLNGLIDAEGRPHAESRAFLIALLEWVIEAMPGRPEEKHYEPEELGDAILDWIDADDTARLGEPEARRHGGLTEDATPLDRPLFDLGELAAVPGLDAALLEALEHYCTTFPLFVPVEEAGINPNTAAPHVLALIYEGGGIEEKQLLGKDPDDVLRVLRVRDEGRAFCDVQHDDCVGFAPEIIPLGDSVFPPLVYTSDTFAIESEGRFGNARARVVTVVDRGDLEGGAPATLYYRMD